MNLRPQRALDVERRHASRPVQNQTRRGARRRPASIVTEDRPMEPTIFTRIVNRELPAALVYEDEHTIAFMDAGQVNPGHVIVATKKQVETLLDLDDELAGALFRTAAKIAKAVDRAFKPEGITVLQANKAAGWQTVPHVHLHVLPRHHDDGVLLTWPRKNPTLDELKSLVARIAVTA